MTSIYFIFTRSVSTASVTENMLVLTHSTDKHATCQLFMPLCDKCCMFLTGCEPDTPSQSAKINVLSFTAYISVVYLGTARRESEDTAQ